jgi:hypothetical protein
MESMVFLADLPQLDLTLLLHSVGVKMWLGKMDVQLSRVRLSYAESAFNGEYITVPAGMRFEADLKFLGMTSLTKFELTAEGASFVADFNSTEVLKVRLVKAILVQQQCLGCHSNKYCKSVEPANKAVSDPMQTDMICG